MVRRFVLSSLVILVGLISIVLTRPTTLLRASLPSAGETAPPVRPPARVVSETERVECQIAIESVFWRYRDWPGENTTAKPPLAAVFTAEMAQARADETLRQSSALAEYWNHPITGAMLAAEMKRMAAESEEPDQLRALFAALDNDPALVAECLARPALAERMVREAYAQDERLHSAIASQAAAGLAGVRTAADLQNVTGGDYDVTVWGIGTPDTTDGDTINILAEGEWERQRQRLAAWYRTTAGEIPVGQVTPLQEDESGYFAVTVLEQSATRMVVARVRWDKRPFDSWWVASKDTFSTRPDIPATTYTLPDIQRQPAGNPGWLPTPSLPAPNVRAVWTGAEMIVFGGGDLGGNRTNAGWRYNPATDTWLTISSVNAPAPRFAHSLIWTGSEMITWGGCTRFQLRICAIGSGGRYNPVTGVWVATSTTNAPDARLYHTAVWTGSEMVVWGGCAYNTNGTSCVEKNTGGRYDPATDTWVATSMANVPAGRYHHTAVWTGTQMIVWGGEDGLNVLNSGGRYDPVTDTWTATTPTNAPAARMQHTAIWTGAEMIVWGGCPDVAECTSQGIPYDTGGRYNPATDTWTSMTTAAAPSPRAEHTAVWTGSEMIVFGGVASTFITTNTGGRYNPVTDSWTPTSTTNAPTPRYAHVAVWSGTEMIVWGGATDAHRTGARYDPATDNWSTVNLSEPYSIRSNHVAVWTGSEMIVWGGDDVGAGSVDTGRIYTPVTRSWRFVPDSGLGGRHFHTAVWTGSEMIVWGGQSGNSVFNTGGRFNPTTNTWAPVATNNAPDGRAWPEAVWTGTEMIVWGGNGEVVSHLNSGGRYNPVTDSWMATSLTGAPAGRYLFDSVWDGDEMIVWGGYSDGGSTNTGGRYRPATDSWLPTSMTNVPAPRHFHTAVWTGEQMIVWGGVFFDTEDNYNSGGRYDPDTDSWQPTSLVGAPEGRVRHTAVWTGAEMIVWGGCLGLYCVSGDALYTGGHYNPIADSWTPTVIDAGLPRARGEHTAVWTGSSMIVWGGYTDLSSYTNTGSEYFVAGGPATPTPTATATQVPVTLTPTATEIPPTVTPSATAILQSPTPTITMVPPSVTPTATGAVPTVTTTSTGTGVPPTTTPSATATATGTMEPPVSRLYLPLIYHGVELSD